jgi:tripartite-type tricarboxylate transporter receptor subunit TctC
VKPSSFRIALGAWVLAIAMQLGIAGEAAAQDKFPSRPLRLIVATPPGGGVDITARLIADLVSPVLGQKVVVVNRPGGAGAVGITEALQSKPDGYALAAIWNGPITILPHTVSLAYSIDDMAPVTQLTGGTPYIFCTKPDFPAKDGKEFIELLKKSPNKYTYGTDGVASTVQLAAERVFRRIGVQARAIPFAGAGETVVAMLGGHIDIYGGTIPTILANVQAGEAKCLLLTSVERNPALPNTMSLRDIGVPEEASELWRGIVAPKGVTPDTLKALNQAFRQAAESAKFKEFIASRGEAVVDGAPGDFAKVIASEYKANGEIIAALGVVKK